MLQIIGRWLKIYEDEIGLFLWTMVLLFLIRSSGIIFNNFAETAFLKRYGVEYLPIVYMLNSIVTFVIMGVLAGIMARTPGARLLLYLLLFCGGSVAGLRFLIPLGFDLLYPLLFVMKAQYEILLGLLFWNLANDLFNTRQSKRLFPLITAGGVLGEIIGSFGTPVLAKLISMDNLMLIYLGTCIASAVAVKNMGSRFPTVLFVDKKPGKPKSRTGIISEVKKILPLMKESKLVKILILLTFLPNVVIPILNYQFNFVVDAQFATESGMIAFFGYFRGAMNIISLFLLLFVGRIYGRWGLPVALMFHPFNYMLVFLAFLLRFDIFAAMYARMSTNIIRTTLNKPATAILMGLFPESYRAAVRPFLRGTVVRIGLIVSSTMILISEKLFHPRYLSLVAIPLVSAWIMTTWFLKKSYSNILLDLISKNMLDLKSMEEEDVEQLFKDEQSRSHLVEAFLAARGEDALWFARLLNFLAVKDLDTHIIATLNNQDDRAQIELINMLSGDLGEAAVPALRPLVDPEKPELMVAVIRAVNRLSPDYCWDFDLKAFETNKHPEVKAYALVGLFCQEPEHYRITIDSWLDSDDMHDRKAGVIAAGESGEDVYVVRLKAMLDAAENESILDMILQAIHRLGTPEMNDLVFFYLDHPLESVRIAALEAFTIQDDQTLNRVVSLMADPSEGVYRKAKAKIDTASYHNGQLLVESLSTPRRRVREGLFDLLASLDVKDLDAFRFARSQIETCYNYLSEAEAIRLLPQSPGRNLLMDHLEQKRNIRLENILRVLALKDRSGQMRIILRSIFSSDKRQRANGLEALDAITDAALSKLLIPLLDDSPVADTLAAGSKHFRLPVLSTDGNTLYAHQLAQEDWVTNVITLYMAQEHDLETLDQGMVRVLTVSGNTHVRQMARYILARQQGHFANKEDTMEPEISIPDKIIHLKEIGIFKGLSVGELAAIASVSEEVVYAPDETVIKEGETGETMYMIVEGELSVFKHGTEIDQFGAGESFGEMALIEDEVRSATIRTNKASRFLVLHKQEFKEIVQEYPQIALSICKVLSGYVRKLHLKATAQEK